MISLAAVLLQTEIGARLMALQFSTGHFLYTQKRDDSEV